MPDYSSLEEVYGTPFGKRSPVTQAAEAEVRPVMARKTDEQLTKHKSLLDQLARSLPISTEEPNYQASQPTFGRVATETTVKAREAFSDFHYAPPQYESKQLQQQIERILKLVEQNKTGYETPSSHDMLLYIFTGVFFLFTFDQFVVLGKHMR